MVKKIGIRREDKNRWEKRVPITPGAIRDLKKNAGLDFVVQPSHIRVYQDDEYLSAGAAVHEDLSPCPVVFGVKEVPVQTLVPGHTYVFFSHTIKGQKYNMPMLRAVLDRKCCLIDYERIVDETGRRLVFFGNYAGLAGMIDSLWALGRRLAEEGIENPFSCIGMAHSYGDLENARENLSSVARYIKEKGVPPSIRPFVCGFAGYGNVSKGAQEIFNIFPHIEISPEELLSEKLDSRLPYKVVFKEKDIVTPVDPEAPFELQEYYKNPKKYKSCFEQYLPHITVMMNCIYWNESYPRLVTKEYLRNAYRGNGNMPKLKVIGDISCDIGGSVECTLKATNPDNPVFVYDPFSDRAMDGFRGNGPVVMAVDNLPCELPKESSDNFSESLLPFIPDIACADYSVPFSESTLPVPVKKAVITYGGELTPDYEYLRDCIG